MDKKIIHRKGKKMNSTQLAPAIFQYNFPETLASNIVDMIEESPDIPWRKSGISADGITEQEIRTSNGFSFSEVFPFWTDEVKRYFVEAVNDYCQNNEDAIVMQDEGFGLLRYEGTSKYDFHSDASWSSYRTVSALIYLNPADYEGGETFFKNFDVKVKPEKPAIVIFPSNYAYLHAALPTTSGKKYVLVTWMNDLPQGLGPTVMRDLARITGR
jgi:hypothetical protein